VGGCVRRFQPFFVSARVSRFPVALHGGGDPGRSAWSRDTFSAPPPRFSARRASAWFTNRCRIIRAVIPKKPQIRMVFHVYRMVAAGFRSFARGIHFRVGAAGPAVRHAVASSTLPIVRTLQSWFRTSTTCLIDLLHIHRIGELTCEIALILSNHPDVASFASFTASRSTRFQSAPVRRRKPKRSR
jgi:hypothetical protein